jgi:DNA excision repair protein ERCC-1
MKLPLTISKRQEKNPLIPLLSVAQSEWSDTTVADYSIGRDIAVLFLTLKYHRLHPEYLSTRIRDFRGSFPVRILLFLINDENPDQIISKLTVLSIANNMNLMLAFDYEEAARWIISLYTTQDAPVDDLKASNETMHEIAVDSLNALGTSKKEAESLLTELPSLGEIICSSKETLRKSCVLSDKKVDNFLAAVEEPFGGPDLV